MKVKKYSAVIVGAGNIGTGFDKPKSKNILTHANALLKNRRINLLGIIVLRFSR